VSAIRSCCHTRLIARPQPPSTFNWTCSDPKPTIRNCDQATNIPKVAAQDTTLTVNNVDGGKTTFPVPSGTEIDLHVAGLHYNRSLSGFVSWERVLIKGRSAVLEGSSQVHARTVPWRLAQGRLSFLQSRYVLPIPAPKS
jgi:hypothetical protein